MKKARRNPKPSKRYIECDPGYVSIELKELAKHYPQFDWMNEKCVICHLPATYLVCTNVHNEKFADYEPRDPIFKMAVFELRSEFGTNFEVPVCESHISGETD